MPLKLSRYVVPSPSFRETTEEPSRRLVFSTRSLRTILVTDNLWARLQNGEFESCSREVLSQLSDALILVPAGDDELADVLRVSREAIDTHRTLYECIQPTGFCSLRCNYCGQDHSRSQISLADQNSLVARIHRKLTIGSYDRLQIGWFGGEPLSAMSVVRALSRRLQQTAGECGCQYQAQLTTNGLALTPRLARELVEAYGVTKIEVTRDGAADTHDQRRPMASGRGTYQRIYQNLGDLLKLDLPAQVSVRCNVDRRNADGVPELIDAIAALRPTNRLRLYFAPVHDWGNQASGLSLSPDEFADLEIEWATLMLQSGLSPALLPDAKPIVCMAVNRHSELIDPQGQIYNCTEVSLIPGLGNPNRYARGSLREAGSSARADQLAGFHDDVKDGQFDCSSCAMLPVCGGGCPKQWNDGNKPCPSAKRNLPARLLLAYGASRSLNTGHA